MKLNIERCIEYFSKFGCEITEYNFEDIDLNNRHLIVGDNMGYILIYPDIEYENSNLIVSGVMRIPSSDLEFILDGHIFSSWNTTLFSIDYMDDLENLYNSEFDFNFINC